MSKQDINQEFNTFVGGILTEANPINYPVGYTLDEENFILERNGTRRRRYGLQKQAVDNTITLGPSSLSGSLVWKNAGNSSDDIYVAWQGGLLSAHRLDRNLVFAGAVPYTKYDTDLVEIKALTGPFIGTVTTFQGKLVVIYFTSVYDTFHTSGSYDTVTVPAYEVYSYNSSSATLTLEQSTTFFEVRDFEGEDVKLDLDDRPVSLTGAHQYNLLNNGWTTTNINQYFTDLGVYPSLSDSMNSGLDAATGAFNSSWVQEANTGQRSYNGGRYVLNAFARGYARGGILVDKEGFTEAAAKTAVTEGTAGGKIVAAVEWSGRLCSLGYTGVGTSNTVSRVSIYISKVVQDLSEIGKCYQINDPTSRDFSTPLDTDGLTLELDDIGYPLAMSLGKNGLLVVGTEGVFEVFSRDGVFRPADLSIRKISDFKPLFNTWSPYVSTRHPVLSDEGNLYYLAREGIIGCIYDPANRNYTPINLTAPSIDTLYRESISALTGSEALGFYSSTSKTLRFLFKGDQSAVTDKVLGVTGDTELVYDLVLKAWTKNVYPTAARYVNNELLGYGILDIFEMSQIVSTDLEYPYPLANTYLINVLDYTVGTTPSNPTRTLYFAHHTPGEFSDINISNIQDADIDVPAFMQTGYINAGDSQRFKQTNYIVPSFLRTENGFTDDGSGNLTPTNESSCMISAWWDYADDESSAKVNAPFEAYRYNRLYIPSGPADTFDYGQSVITTKNRLTGRGRALSLRFESSPGKDCQLLGWGMDLGVQTKV